MAQLEKKGGAEAVAEEEERLLMEESTFLDIDLLCSAVVMQAHKGKWGMLNGDTEEDNLVSDYQQHGGGAFRMWEGELVNDCFDDRRIAFQSVCCPCYRFGKNMKRAGFGSCFLQGGDNSFDDCIFHFICPCCTLCQESRTLEMNNVQDGIWHGRGDTICIGSLSEDSKPHLELTPPFVLSTKSPEFLSMQKTSDDSIHLSTSAVGHSSPLVPPPE